LFILSYGIAFLFYIAHRFFSLRALALTGSSYFKKILGNSQSRTSSVTTITIRSVFGENQYPFAIAIRVIDELIHFKGNFLCVGIK
jgi:hypothetical protein